MKIIDYIYVVPGVFANCYLLVDPEGITMIDTGIPHSEKQILEYLTSLGKSPPDVKRILITHSDWDHVGSLAALHQATGACTYSSKIEAARSPPANPLVRVPAGRIFTAAVVEIFGADLFMPSTRFQVDANPGRRTGIARVW